MGDASGVDRLAAFVLDVKKVPRHVGQCGVPGNVPS
jgi:hypothetical protein